MKIEKTELKIWQWKEKNAPVESILHEASSVSDNSGTGWQDASAYPSEIHVELVKKGSIPDPFLGFNEHEVQWVGEREWLYRTTFSFDGNNKGASTDLIFEGLDTFCDVYLNGELISSTDNMFRTYVVNIDPKPLTPEGNTLFLHFKCAKSIALEREKEFGRVRAGSTNLGAPSRVYVRKAQYGWRWDWGPELMTCGPYRPIHLITYNARISNLHTKAVVSEDLAAALNVDATFIGDLSAVKGLSVLLKDSSGTIIKQSEVELALHGAEDEKSDIVTWTLGQDTVKLWWPVGYGSQELYTVEVLMLGENNFILDQQTERIGFRRVQLIQQPLTEPDQYGTGTSFLLEINGVRIFMGGSNWIPAHNFLTALTPEKYREWLVLLKEGNQNMVRLWGGGVYEPDCFYDTCDELGILVWQDFQFACGVYPAHDSFVATVKAEAEDNVKRLRRHPSMTIFCGNNEDYQMILQWGDVAELPARKLYEEIFPEVVERLTDPPIPYHRGSPYGGKGWDTADPTVGDVHQWDIWGGKERPWQEYSKMGGRFVSEFGIPAYPDIRTVDYWVDGDVKQRWPGSKLMAQHNRAGMHERRFAILLNENFRMTGDLDVYAYNTQIMQSEAVSYAYRVWRREWRGKGKEYCSGVLVWQLNDCWPVTSWALADFFLRKKPAFYTIARELKPVTVGMLRTVKKDRDNDRPAQYYEFGAFLSIDAELEIWASNLTLQEQKIKLELEFADLLSSWTQKETHEFQLKANQTTELLKIPFPSPPSQVGGVTASHSVVAAAKLLDSGTSKVLSRLVDWPQPFRHVDFPEPGVKLSVNGEEITVEVENPVKALVLSADGEGKEVNWSDNALDVMPGDKQVIIAGGLEGRAIKVSYMGKEIASKV